jgi:hypothetical protein
VTTVSLLGGVITADAVTAKTDAATTTGQASGSRGDRT